MRECPQCRALFEPYKRAEGRQVFCSPACRKWAWEGRPVQNRDKLTRAERILARLRQGPATGLELLKAGGGTRYGARIKNLRERGCVIETDMGGEWPTYRLISEP